MLGQRTWPWLSRALPASPLPRVVALFTVLTLVMTYPLWVRPASTLPTDIRDGDTALVIWILSWDAHAFLHQPFSIFDTNIFHPLRDTLAYAENMIGIALFSAPVQWLSGNPVLALNAVLLLSCILCGVGAWLLGRQAGLGQEASVLAGIIFAFAPPRFLRIEQVFLASMQWIPFGLASLHAYLDGGRPRHLKLVALFFSLQALSSGHGGVFMLVACGTLLAYRVVLGQPVRPIRWIRDLGLTGFACLAPVILVAQVYRRVRTEMGFERSLSDWSISGVSFLASPTHFHAWLASLAPNARILDNADAYLFPGFLVILLACASLAVRPPAEAAPVTGSGEQPAGWRQRVSAWGAELQARAHAPDQDASFLVVPDARTVASVASGPWRRVAILFEILAVVALTAAIVVAVYRPGRVRIGGIVIFSARNAWRSWLVVLLAVGARVVLTRLVPFDTPSRWFRWCRHWSGRGLHLGRRIWRRVAQLLGVARSAFAAVIAEWRRVAGPYRTSALGFYGTLTLLVILLVIGPPLSIWPYAFRLPGFDTIRVPSRFTILGMLSLAILAGIGFERICGRLRRINSTTAALVGGGLLLLEFLVIPLPTFPVGVEIPLVDRWLATQPSNIVIAELPLEDPSPYVLAANRQSLFMLHSTAHWRKTVNGYSGWPPPAHLQLFGEMLRFPSDESLRGLSEFGVTHVVVHTDLYPSGEWPRVEDRIRRYAERLRLVRVDGPGRVYALLRPSKP